MLVFSHVKKGLQVTLIYSLAFFLFSCSSEPDLEDLYVDEFQEIDKYYLSEVYKIEGKMYVNAGVQDAGKIKAEKLILIGNFLYSVKEIPFSDKELEKVSELFIKGGWEYESSQG